MTSPLPLKLALQHIGNGKQTVIIEVWRNEEPVCVAVEILSSYLGTGAVDDPSSCEADAYGYDQDGASIELTEEEVRSAEEAYLTGGA